jgi:hypothetical protein
MEKQAGQGLLLMNHVNSQKQSAQWQGGATAPPGMMAARLRGPAVSENVPGIIGK